MLNKVARLICFIMINIVLSSMAYHFSGREASSTVQQFTWVKADDVANIYVSKGTFKLCSVNLGIKRNCSHSRYVLSAFTASEY